MKNFAFAVLMFTAFVGLVLADNAPKEKLLFQEDFAKELDKGWSWVREDPKAWKRGENDLQIRTFPGVALWLGMNNAKNVLLREMPETKPGILLAEVHLSNEPSSAWEHAGVLWYVDDDNYVFVVKEHYEGKPNVVMTREEKGQGKVVNHIAYDKKDVDLRLKISKDKIEGWYRSSEKDEWQKIGQCELPSKAKARTGLIACHGPKDKENWARFTRFRLSETTE